MLSESLNNDSLSKPCAPALTVMVLESYTDVLPVHDNVITKLTHYESQKFMQVCLVDMQNSVTISGASSTELGLLKATTEYSNTID